VRPSKLLFVSIAAVCVLTLAVLYGTSWLPNRSHHARRVAYVAYDSQGRKLASLMDGKRATPEQMAWYKQHSPRFGTAVVVQASCEAPSKSKPGMLSAVASKLWSLVEGTAYANAGGNCVTQAGSASYDCTGGTCGGPASASETVLGARIRLVCCSGACVLRRHHAAYDVPINPVVFCRRHCSGVCAAPELYACAYARRGTGFHCSHVAISLGGGLSAQVHSSNRKREPYGLDDRQNRQDGDSRDGNLVSRSSYVQIRDVTADRSGNLYASAEVWAPGGAGTGVICKISPGGKTIRVTRTDDFLPISLAVAQNDDVWAFGIPLLLITVKKSTMEYNTLWHFDSAGKLLEQTLPRSTFGPGTEPAHLFGDVGGPHLQATSTRLGLYSATAERWVEYDLRLGKQILDLKVPRLTGPDGVKATLWDLVMTDSDNDVYAFYAYRSPDASHRTAVYRLDKSTAKWIAVHESSGSTEFGALYGADGEELILRAGSGTFGWFPGSSLRGNQPASR
jgi:hypothetical protein